jgi:hypothetical protein
MSRGNVARRLHTPDPPESVDAYVIRNAEIELRNLRRHLGSDPEWNARLATRPGPVRTGPPAWFPGRPRGRPRRWLRDYYVNKAIDRLPPWAQPSKLALASKRLRKVERLTYHPGSDRLLDEDGQSALNLYRPSMVAPVPGDVGPWLDLVHRVVPNEPAREHVLNFFAHLVQYPGVKINHSLFLGSKVQASARTPSRSRS